MVALAKVPSNLAVRIVKSLAIADGDVAAAAAFAQAQRWNNGDQVAEYVRSAVSASTPSSDPGIVGAVGADLAALAVPFSAVLRMQGFRRVPAKVSLISATGGTTAYWGDFYQSGGSAIPPSALAFSRQNPMQYLRVAAVSVISKELARTSDPAAEEAIGRDLGRAIGIAIDQAFLDPFTSGSPATRPASVTASGRIFTASASTLDGIDSDLEKLITALHDNGSNLESATWVLNTLSATRLARMRGSSGAPAYPGVTVRGGMLMGLPVLVTGNVPRSGSPSPGATNVHLIDPSRIWYVDSGAGSVETSDVADVHMDSAPTGDASSGTASSIINLFQTDSIGLKLTRWINWAPVAGQSHAATLTGAEW